MRPFRKRFTPITLVSNDEVYFILQESSGEGKISEPISLDRLLTNEADLSSIPPAFHQQGNSVMVVPDYWVGSVSFPFESRRKSLTEAFLARKLHAECPEIPEVKDFFTYFFRKSGDGKTDVHAYFLQDPTFFQLHEQLSRRKLRPRRITAPAFLWEARLKERLEGFQQEGTAFLHNLSNECFLYFFFDGRFLFSRQITLPTFEGDASDQVETLTYETHQSLYLFSQKAKAEIDRVYMVCFGYVEAEALSESLGMEVREVPGLEEELTENTITIGHPGLLSGFTLPDLSRSHAYLSLSNRQIEKEQAWKPVQKVGIAVGLALLLLLSGEAFLLWQWSRPVRMETTPRASTREREAVEALRQYNEALDLFLKESQRPSASKAIISLARAMPENFWIKEMVVETEPNPGVVLTGTVRATNPGQFRETLSLFLDNLNEHFQGTRSLGLKDIDFDINNCQAGDGAHTCVIAMEFALP